MESSIDGPNSSHKRRHKKVTIAASSKDGGTARSRAGAKSALEDKLAALSVSDQSVKEGTADNDGNGSMNDLPRSDNLDDQQISRIYRLQKIFSTVHQSFKTRETALTYFTKNKLHPEYDIIKWELISLAYCVELCVKYEQHVLTQGRKVLEAVPDILTRLSEESDDAEDQMHVIVLPARQVCKETGQLQWLAGGDAAPRILVVPKQAIENETNLRILSEHGEVFAELWKMYRDVGAEDRLKSIHGMLESLTLPPVEVLPPVKQRCAILKRLMTLSSNANFAGFERRLAKDLFCSDRFGDGADSWIFSFMIWKCVYEVHGDRLSREEHVSRGQK
ncbi:hypothetical protein HDU81_005007 [Chytriomyces hyalinus]|nr:hypothetical protein HDU81_005007 [Chytriomyces hyalinus]